MRRGRYQKTSFWILIGVGKIIEASALIIRLDATPSGPSMPPPPSSPQFYAGCPSCRNPPNLSWLGTGTKYAGLQSWRLIMASYYTNKNTPTGSTSKRDTTRPCHVARGDYYCLFWRGLFRAPRYRFPCGLWPVVANVWKTKVSCWRRRRPRVREYVCVSGRNAYTWIIATVDVILFL